MLFNSVEFIFGFLPITLAGFFAIGLFSRTWALRWIVLTSLFFYAWWRPLNVLIIAPSIIINFVAALALRNLAVNERRRWLAQTILFLGIAFNVVFLGYFKYSDFFRVTVNDVFGTNLVLMHIVLPLGISFITFQKIAFLIDVYAGRVKTFSLQDYCLFVLFFPQLIAGPIVHFREVMPQFHNASCRLDSENISVALTLFCFGLFKKVFLADTIGPLISPIYDQAANGQNIFVLQAWLAAIGFTLQIYFDFSGYTDMALGLARFFGIRLPPNFNSPLQASSIIDFWLRWHMTLTRFLTAYIYNPLALSLTRRRVSKGRSSFGGQNATISAFFVLLALPTILTMFVSGLWHGAGYLFVLWGLVHGVYLVINHAWRSIGPSLFSDRKRYDRLMTPIGGVITFVAVTTAMVLFRSTTTGAATNLLKGMIGLNGIAVPSQIYDHLGRVAVWMRSLGIVVTEGSSRGLSTTMFWILVLTYIALVCPNSLQLLARYEPALGVNPRPTGRSIEWNASLPWAIVVSIVVLTAFVLIGSAGEFLYWQF